jgi:hypothetical protein
MATDTGLADWHDAVLRGGNSGRGELLACGNAGHAEMLGGFRSADVRAGASPLTLSGGQTRAGRAGLKYHARQANAQMGQKRRLSRAWNTVEGPYRSQAALQDPLP